MSLMIIPIGMPVFPWAVAQTLLMVDRLLGANLFKGKAVETTRKKSSDFGEGKWLIFMVNE